MENIDSLFAIRNSQKGRSAKLAAKKKNRGGACLFVFAKPRKTFGGETPTDANVIMPGLTGPTAPPSGAHDCRRSTAALAKGTFVVFGATPGQASWDVAAFVRRVLPAPACP